MTDYRPLEQRSTPSRGTLRLTFRSTGGQVELVSKERLDMICPPSVGERPEAGKQGGFWLELRGDGGDVTFFRVLHDPIRSSVEVHSPDGQIRREFGPPGDSTFEVLVPDDPRAATVALMGEYEDPSAAKGRRRKARAPSGAREIARFDLAGGDDTTEGPGGAA